MSNSKISALTAATTPVAGTEVLPIVQSSVTKQVSIANLTAGRAVSGASFVVTGSTAPANGIYLFTTNTVSIATNSTERFRVGSGGDLTLIGTGSGNAQTFYNTGSNSGARTMFSFNYITAAFSGYAAIKGVTETTYDDSLSLEFYTGGGTKRVTMAAGGDVTLNTGNLIQGTAAKGINFTANTGAAGKTSQLLNWYEEGTWTPADGSGAGLTLTNEATATYTRIGRVVTVTFWVKYPITASGANAVINGLPFTSASGTSGSVTINQTEVTTPYTGAVQQSTQQMTFFTFGNTSLTNANFSNLRIRATATYFV